eukprot:15547336-Heterocapsa_arctica.AAC.1
MSGNYKLVCRRRRSRGAEAPGKHTYNAAKQRKEQGTGNTNEHNEKTNGNHQHRIERMTTF